MGDRVQRTDRRGISLPPGGARSPEELLRRYEAATAAHDLPGTLDLVADDAVYWFSTGAEHVGREAVRQALRANFEAIEAEHYALSDVTWLARSDDMAACTFRFQWAGRVKGEAASGSGRGTSILVRREGAWVVVHEHLSREGPR